MPKLDENHHCKPCNKKTATMAELGYCAIHQVVCSNGHKPWAHYKGEPCSACGGRERRGETQARRERERQRDEERVRREQASWGVSGLTSGKKGSKRSQNPSSPHTSRPVESYSRPPRSHAPPPSALYNTSHRDFAHRPLVSTAMPGASAFSRGHSSSGYDRGSRDDRSSTRDHERSSSRVRSESSSRGYDRSSSRMRSESSSRDPRTRSSSRDPHRSSSRDRYGADSRDTHRSSSRDPYGSSSRDSHRTIPSRSSYGAWNLAPTFGLDHPSVGKYYY